MAGRKEHWDRIYGERKPEDVSWFQRDPAKSLELLRASGASGDSAVVDVGGGASVLVDRLLDLGFRRPAVLDVSAAALAYSRTRLGERAAQVRWVEADITSFESDLPCDVWHDRAVFHFLTEVSDREKYVGLLRRSLRPGGHVILAAFAPDGPEKCSGLPVRRYDSALLRDALGDGFSLVREDMESHRTPADKEQKFRYFLLKRT